MEEAKIRTMKLVISQGPRQGETLECRSNSSMRIGRVVRGNNFAIKDPAISQKHLEITFSDGKWTVCDLETSNGTFLNDNKLVALSPYSLSSGDIIKIGDSTSMTVQIDEVTDAGPNPVEKQPRRDRRRQAPKSKARVDSEDNPVQSESVAAGKILERSNLEVGTSKENFDLDNVLAENGRRRNPRRQTAKKAAPCVSALKRSAAGLDAKITVKIEQNSDLEDAPLAPLENALRRNPRRCAAPIKGSVASKDDLPQSESVPVERVSERSEGNMVETVPVEGKNGSDNVPVENRARRNPRKQVALDRVGNAAMSQKATKESGPVGKVLEKVDLLQEKIRAVQENSNVTKDLEKITLGEWFDRMETYLPKQINDAAEEIIQTLRQRQKQFHEFLEQQRDGKGKLPMAS